MADEQLITDLKAARAELVKRGRCRGRLVTESGQVCARGATAVVAADKFEALYLSRAKDAQGDQSWTYELTTPRARLAEQALRRHLPGPYRGIESFNDDLRTTDQDVLNLFDKALADLGGLA